ncbi:DUF1365 domain-containing protein [Nocardia otitidiscaviarum]|uniref:DUF1365 domain-containing protein n=1 Tax=Nocardia otitidiscaviarum TaxID=1823 RepID=UPI0018944304|nr:DUF1365 domain-containing protein [Nocardia otitidiscaviarum]MBF6237567.1 DUF1365 domain-containing protein [Nocardia otitidiscaviarum]
MTAPRLVRTVIRHTRTEPVRHRFTYRSYSWLVDLDEPPRLPWYLRPFARLDDGHDVRAVVERCLADNGIDADGGHVLMLTNARVLGYAFNPLTVYWCHDRAGAVRAVVAEVHNTYGGVHRYVVEPDARAESTVAKRFHVSPFNPVAGRYRLRAPVPTDRLRLAIVLDRPDGRTFFAASMSGRVLPADPRTLLRVLLTHPLETWRVTARIRWQGLRLWARGLPVLPRPQHIS